MSSIFTTWNLESKLGFFM